MNIRIVVYELLAILMCCGCAAGSESQPPDLSASFLRYIDVSENIHRAVAVRDTGALSLALASDNVDVDRQTSVGPGSHHANVSGLMFAALTGWSEGVQLLLDHGADVSLQSEIGATVLHYAASTECAECVRVVLEAGAAVDAVDNWGVVPLYNALSDSNLEVAMLLIEAGAVVESDMLCSVATNTDIDPSIVPILINHGADPNSECGEIPSTLLMAIESRSDAIAVALIGVVDEHILELPDEDGNTPFLSAADNGACDVLEALIERGANPRRVNASGENALHHSAFHPAAGRCYEWLIEVVEDVNQRDDQGATPLIRAASRPERSILLLNAGACVDAMDHNGDSALHRVVRSMRNPQPALTLIRAGARTDVPDSHGVLPIERVKHHVENDRQWADEWQAVYEELANDPHP